MRQTFSIAAALATTFSLCVSASDIPQCGDGTLCPKDSPCCSQYGQCGVGAYCLGGCDPQNSYSLDSCMAEPLCKSADYKLTSLDDVQANTQYLGNPKGVNWVSSGQPVPYENEAILLTMAQDTVGTLLMSTHYVWYGKISATMTTSQGQGVVTAFIMMSDVKDEIDFEFVGVDLEAAQSNYYFQGITDYNNGGNISTTNTVENMHTYTFDWTPETLTWAIDGKIGRTLHKKDTWNSTDNKYHYPQTPSRVQLSLWPAGLPSNAKGTINWAGGLINWNSPYMQKGYYYAQVKEVTVECYNPPSGIQQNGDKAYYYTNTDGLQNDVAIGNNNTVLGSFLASGEKPQYNPSASATKGGGSKPTSTPETVPGLSGGGAQQIGGGQSGGGSGVSSAPGSSPTGSSFTQGGGTNEASTLYAGSAVALLGFIVAALVW